MRLLDRFFGGGNNEVQASDKTMDDDQFWKIIQTTFDKSKGDFEKQQAELKNLLLTFKPKDILLFDNKFRQLRGEAYDWRLWGAIYIIHGGCSDDSFMDFRDWVIAQGKEFYYRTLNNPETLVDVDTERIDIDWEGMGYIPSEAFTELTEKDMPEGIDENHDIKGEEWREDNDDLQKMLPKLWAKYS